MRLDELLNRLDTAHARLEYVDGKLRLEGRASIANDPDIASAIRRHRVLLFAQVLGRRTGHTVGFCTVCGRPSMTHYAPPGKYPSCRMTPRCQGRHEPRQADVDRLKAAGLPAAPKAPVPPRKPAHKRFLGPHLPYPPIMPHTHPCPRRKHGDTTGDTPPSKVSP